MHFMKEHKPDDGAPGVALPFIQNNDNATIKRAAGCAVLDKIHDEKGIYAQKAAVSNGFITQVEDIFEKNLSTVLQIDNGKKA